MVLHEKVWIGREVRENSTEMYDGSTTAVRCAVKKKVWFYIALYPVRWTAQSALHFPPLADLFILTPFSASLGSILAMQLLRNDYSLTFPPLSIAGRGDGGVRGEGGTASRIGFEPLFVCNGDG